jgi:hypothetical protein
MARCHHYIIAAIATICLASCRAQTLCIVAGTGVATPSGVVPIEHLRIGDPIYSVSPSGELTSGTVSGMRATRSQPWLSITVDGDAEILRATSAHPIGTAAGWREAGDLDVGDSVLTPTGLRAIRSISENSSEVVVYDLSVQPFPAYVAGGVIVHNKTIAAPPEPPTMGTTASVSWIGSTTDLSTIMRLTLDSNGTGLFGCATAPDSDNAFAWLYRIDAWRLDSFDIVAPLIPLDRPPRWGPSDSLVLRGKAFSGPYRWRLELEIEGWGGQAEDRRLIMIPEGQVSSAIDTLVLRMREHVHGRR